MWPVVGGGPAANAGKSAKVSVSKTRRAKAVDKLAERRPQAALQRCRLLQLQQLQCRAVDRLAGALGAYSLSIHPLNRRPPTADRRRCCRPVYSFSYSIHPPPPCLAPCCPGDYPASSARLPMSVPRRSHLAGYYGAQHKGPTPPSLETVGHSRASCTRAPISGSKENGQSKLALRRSARRRGALGEHQPGSRPSCS